MRWLFRVAALAAWASRRCLRLQSWANGRAVPVRAIPPPLPNAAVPPSRPGFDIGRLPVFFGLDLVKPEHAADFKQAADEREAIQLLGRNNRAQA